MDLRPTSSAAAAAVAPASRKSLAPTKKKPLCAPKPSREPSAVPARYRQPPKRAFGTVRSTNSTVEAETHHKPPLPKPPSRKLRLVPIKPQDAGKTAGGGPTKPLAVDKAPDAHPRSPSPTLPKPPPAAETPFHSARRCSDCTVERLESSSYWIAQIKLAESAGKHSVSAAFFQLGFECQAEPLRKLRLELWSYANRHGLVSEAWSDIHRLYGMLPTEKAAEALDSTTLLGLSSETISSDAGAETHDDCDGCGDCGSEGMQEEDWVTKDDDECCDESLEKSLMEGGGGDVADEEHGDDLQVKNDSNLTSD